MNVVYTHRGFVLPRTAVGNDPRIEWYSTAALEHFNEDIEHQAAPVLSWEWRRDLIQTCKALLEAHGNFVQLQLNSGAPVATRAIDFLYSTFMFIKTGRRAVSIYNWRDLLEYHPAPYPVPRKVLFDFEREFGSLLTLPMAKLIPLWLQRPMGLQDLLLTCHLIFGPLPDHFDKAKRL